MSLAAATDVLFAVSKMETDSVTQRVSFVVVNFVNGGLADPSTLFFITSLDRSGSLTLFLTMSSTLFFIMSLGDRCTLFFTMFRLGVSGMRISPK